MAAALALSLVCAIAAGKGQKPNADAQRKIVRIDLTGVIGQASKNYVVRAVNYAERHDAELLLITIDTPGGLMDSMKDIATAMINAKVPVVVYVYPNGSTATSAGFFILMASDVAAMAPDTSTGSAHPVDIGGGGGGEQKTDNVMKEKVTNYAVKYMQQLTERRSRNRTIGERAVRKSISVTSDEALKDGVVEIVANSVEELMSKLDGRVIVKGAPRTAKIKLKSESREVFEALKAAGLASGDAAERRGTVAVNLEKISTKLFNVLKDNGIVDGKVLRFRLKTKSAPVEELPMSFRENFFKTIGHPNIVYILMIVGVYALIFEVTHPGIVAPGVIGVLCLVIAFTSFQVIPINTVGLLMILGAFVLFVLELKFTSYGLLSIGGVTLMILGSLMLVDSKESFMKVDIWLILSATGTTAFLILVALAAVIKTHKNKVTTGIQGMVGESGKAVTEVGEEGKVFVRGELWNARTADGSAISKNTRIEVVSLDGMTAVVKVK